ncbi:hypothetical protein BESB_010550 [Besnoitia besnoiti]|uniref:RNA-editing substrate-binding complex 6 protein domain-containing protein n=1 Tax=Besnoitia besnoiti TaxID=94643 RepID=A0A2A9MQS4_BESBE|nr:hypothetical protein BESB_010550 [Besnoitia besnoiti]PFH38713.1 hypothetical protein BESB_010550 [Besnoitia besnoiti]
MKGRTPTVTCRRRNASSSPSYFPGESVAGPSALHPPAFLVVPCYSPDNRKLRQGLAAPHDAPPREYNGQRAQWCLTNRRKQQMMGGLSRPSFGWLSAVANHWNRSSNRPAPVPWGRSDQARISTAALSSSMTAVNSLPKRHKSSDNAICQGDEDAVTASNDTQSPEAVPIEMLGPFALSRSIIKAFREDERDMTLWRRFACRTQVLLPSLPPSSLVPVLGAFATLGYRDRDLLGGAAEVLIPQLSLCTGKEVCRVTHHYAQLLARHDLLFSVCARELARRAHELQPNEVARVLHSYARLGYFHPHLFAVLRRRLFEVSKQLEPGALVLIVSAAARLRLCDEKLLAVVSAEICRRIGDVNVKGLAVVANACAELGVGNLFLLEILADEAFRKRAERRPQDVALLLRALGRLGHHCMSSKRQRALVDDLTRDLPKHLKKFSLEQVCMTVSALSRLWRDTSAVPRDGPSTRNDLLEALGDRVGDLAPELTPQSAAALVFAFAKLGYRHGPLLYHVPEHVERFLPDYSIDQLAKICFAYSKLQVPNAPVLQLTLQHLPKLLSRARRQGAAEAGMRNTGETTREPSPVRPGKTVVPHQVGEAACSDTKNKHASSESSMRDLDLGGGTAILESEGVCRNREAKDDSGGVLRPRRKSQSRLVRLYAGRASDSIHHASSLPPSSSPPAADDNDVESGSSDRSSALKLEGKGSERRLPGGLSFAFSKALVKVGTDGQPESSAADPTSGSIQPRLHSVLRILRAMLQLNIFDREALTVMGDHLAERAAEMPSFALVTVVDLYASLGFLHRPLIERIRIELRDPREDISFTQTELRRLYDALHVRLQLSPSEFGVLRVPQTAVDGSTPPSSKREILTCAVLRASAHLDATGGTSGAIFSETQSADRPGHGHEGSAKATGEATETVAPTTWLYLHVPAYLEKLLQPDVQEAISCVAEDSEALEAELRSFDFPVAHTAGFQEKAS